MTDDKRRFPPPKVSADVKRANQELVGARVVSSWITETDGWLALEFQLQHDGCGDEWCTVAVNPTDIRFRRP